MRMNDSADSGFDLYGYRLDRPGEFRITRSNYQAETPYVKTSPATWDSDLSMFVLAYAIDKQLYIVWEDGSSKVGARPQAVALDDVDNDLPFHRVRLNPVYPHILFYRREAKADPNATVGRLAPRMYVADLRSHSPQGVKLFRDEGDVQSSHPGWTSDGLKIATATIWTEFSVVDEHGNIAEKLELANTDGSRIGSFGTDETSPGPVIYGTYSPDGRTIAIATLSTNEKPGELYLVRRDDGSMWRLCQTNYFGRYISGQPRISFVGNTGKILLSTDNSWGNKKPSRPQVYLVNPGALANEIALSSSDK
jgi:hypothetical protein